MSESEGIDSTFLSAGKNTSQGLGSLVTGISEAHPGSGDIGIGIVQGCRNPGVPLYALQKVIQFYALDIPLGKEIPNQRKIQIGPLKMVPYLLRYFIFDIEKTGPSLLFG